MSEIGRAQVLHAAKLAALHVEEAELPRLVEQMRAIVGFVEQLGEVPAGDAAAPFVVGPPAVALRPDVVAPDPLARPPADMAAGFTAGFFTVPRHDAMDDQ